MINWEAGSSINTWVIPDFRFINKALHDALSSLPSTLFLTPSSLSLSFTRILLPSHYHPSLYKPLLSPLRLSLSLPLLAALSFVWHIIISYVNNIYLSVFTFTPSIHTSSLSRALPLPLWSHPTWSSFPLIPSDLVTTLCQPSFTTNVTNTGYKPHRQWFQRHRFSYITWTVDIKLL